MATFTLTTSDDNYTGTVHGDQFSGPSGGTDTLDGGAGKDIFTLDSDEAGTIIGGDGHDTIRLNGFNLGTLTLAKVESLDLVGGGTSATAQQLNSFSKIYSSSGISDIDINLTGDGGTIDFGAVWKGHEKLHIDGFGAGNGTGFTITGTSHQDFIAGSDFTDAIFGGGGDDSLGGRGGSDDTLDGGDGNDTITSFSANTTETGDDGKDTLFSYQGGTMDGGNGNDTLSSTLGSIYIGGAGADHLHASIGADTFQYNAVTDSTSTVYDTIKQIDFSQDRFVVPVAVTGVDAAITTGTLSDASFDTDLAAAVNGGTLAGNHAVLFTADAGTLSGETFLVVDQDGNAGYQAGQDLVIHLNHAENVASFSTPTFG